MGKEKEVTLQCDPPYSGASKWGNLRKGPQPQPTGEGAFVTKWGIFILPSLYCLGEPRKRPQGSWAQLSLREGMERGQEGCLVSSTQLEECSAALDNADR